MWGGLLRGFPEGVSKVSPEGVMEGSPEGDIEGSSEWISWGLSHEEITEGFPCSTCISIEDVF